ncbi:predicted protein [Plenodomus lingam JN3]|uniref:Uncharacterized protein n=1 Tax=Leptosphaeria maculans (strain JN3 / isolate v23.1.3 / race Av1-4-5-6-7-8) TaxID=985895 RepID=E5A6X8_LEPMJ|nr:predicted protein [Plenodomus lingam JN3]CBX99373.1 predicted protein [Plenodomus lingam JN3]
MLLNNPQLEAWIMNNAQEIWPALSRAVDATEKWPGSEEPKESVRLPSTRTDNLLIHQ